MCGAILDEERVTRKNCGGTHRPSSFWAESTFKISSLLTAKDRARHAEPVSFWHLLYSIAALMNCDSTELTEDDQVVVLIVSRIANAALCILVTDASLQHKLLGLTLVFAGF